MKLYWTKKCIENGFRCPNCQLLIADSKGQLPVSSKNHRVEKLDGQIKCVACNTTVGYFPRGKEPDGLPVKFGWSVDILNSIDYITPIDQKSQEA